MAVTPGYDAAAEGGGQNAGAEDSHQDVWPSEWRRTQAETGSIKKGCGHKSQYSGVTRDERAHTQSTRRKSYTPMCRFYTPARCHGLHGSSDIQWAGRRNAFSGPHADVADDMFLICIKPAAMLGCGAVGGDGTRPPQERRHFSRCRFSSAEPQRSPG